MLEFEFAVHLSIGLYALFFLFTFVSLANAADESFPNQFVGSPLLILVAVIIIDVIAFLYHKLKK